MRSMVREVLFSEPSGRPLALIQFSAALLFLGIYGYGVARGSGGPWVLFLAASSVLSGTAESLPSDRRRLAGGLRTAAILICVAMLALLNIAPDTLL